MPLKRTIGFVIIFVVLFFAVVIGVLYTFSFVLPKFLESKIISDLEADTGISEFSFHVRELDLAGADFGDIRFGSESDPALVIRSIQIDYSLPDLYQKKIKKVIASGIELYCHFKDGKFGFRGIDLENLMQRLKSRMRESPASSDAPGLLGLERLTIRNATIICDINSKTYRVPFEIDIVPEDTSFDVLKCTVQIYTRGQKIFVSADIDQKENQIVLNTSAKTVNLARFADFAQLIEGLVVSGVADIKAMAEIKLKPFAVSSVAASLEIDDSRIGFQNIQFKNALNQKKQKLPFHVKLEGTNGNEWKISASTIAASSPIPFHLSKINYAFKLTEDAIEGAGKFVIAPDTSEVWKESAIPVKIVEHFPLRVSSTMKYLKNGNVVFSLKNQIYKKESSQANKFSFERFNIATKQPTVEISGNVSKDKGTATYMVKIPDVLFTSDWSTIELPAIALKGTLDFNRKGKGAQTVAFNLQTPNSEVSLNSAKIKIPQVTLSGKLYMDKTRKRLTDGLLRWADSSMDFSEPKAKITGVHGTLPFQWPYVNKEKRGNFSIDAMHYQKIHLGALSGTLQQTAQGISFKGKHTSRLIPELGLKFNGGAQFFDTNDPKANVHFQLAAPYVKTDIDLGRFLPAAKGVIVSGKVSLDGDMELGNLGLSGTLKSGLNQGKVLLPEKKISIEGIQMALSIPDLPNIRSAPKQQLFFDKAAMGGITVNEGKIEFQLESLSSLFVEKSQFKWCDGNVDTYVIRISPDIEDYRLILYCDRLNMAKVLDQFGAATAVGQGSVNGRIPLRYYKGKLSFNDGVLYSTPGEKGKIRLTDTEILTAGIPPNTPQYIQMELAREALKDYDVAWAKLNISSEGEDLLLRMQLDGKPANPLPFVYKKELGQFTKIEAKGKGSIFQGIRLNVNFRLPLNKILQYKDLIQMIQ
jgi:hypothetical protein